MGENRIDFVFDPANENINGLDDSFRIRCNISAYVREGNYVYLKPEQLVIDIPFSMRNSQLDSPGEEYVKKIKEAEKEHEGAYSTLISNLDSAMVMLQNICSIKQMLDYAELAGTLVQGAGMTMNAIVPGSGLGLRSEKHTS